MNRGIENNKSEYRSEIKNNKRQHDEAAVQTAGIPENYRKVPEFRKIKRKYRGHKIDIIYTVWKL